jgi:1,4-dihydroxy-2-naphthoate polyprenyltransferase
MMNIKMWWKALQIIPKVTREEWDALDRISRWLIAARAAVLPLTLFAALIAGLLAARDGMFEWGYALLVTLGLVAAHAANNLLNDWVDFRKGVDEDNYFRIQYGPQTVQQGLLSERGLLCYAAVPLAVAAACGLALASARGWPILALMAAGGFFLLFYTWPLKYIGLGEAAVILVWGPLMVGGGYYAITGIWDGRVALASLPYALGATTVIFGKHIDKLDADRSKGIHTLPVLTGERLARAAALIMLAAQYLLVIGLVAVGYFSPVLLITCFGLFFLPRVWTMFLRPRPVSAPPGSEGFWPMWFVAAAFYHQRIYGGLLIAGLLASLVVR